MAMPYKSFFCRGWNGLSNTFVCKTEALHLGIRDATRYARRGAMKRFLGELDVENKHLSLAAGVIAFASELTVTRCFLLYAAVGDGRGSSLRQLLVAEPAPIVNVSI